MQYAVDQTEHPHNVIRRVLDTLKGQHVIARRDHDGLYYPGIYRNGRGEGRGEGAGVVNVQTLHPHNVIRRVMDTLKGQHVIARRDHNGLYYPGTYRNGRGGVFYNKRVNRAPTQCDMQNPSILPVSRSNVCV